jgi:hypothetical protein
MALDFRLSVAIPVHNEESVLPELLRRTRSVLDGIEGGPHERFWRLPAEDEQQQAERFHFFNDRQITRAPVRTVLSR